MTGNGTRTPDDLKSWNLAWDMISGGEHRRACVFPAVVASDDEAARIIGRNMAMALEMGSRYTWRLDRDKGVSATLIEPEPEVAEIRTALDEAAS